MDEEIRHAQDEPALVGAVYEHGLSTRTSQSETAGGLDPVNKQAS